MRLWETWLLWSFFICSWIVVSAPDITHYAYSCSLYHFL
uniref:Uncharacterized protein n=1 Tax=Arundo donax TaxID=35708 RepID=A0A0A8YHC4_ARUDO